jgi:UDP-N-acetylmuramate--alanine ligase
MGLITPVELPNLDELGGVHFIAIGGSGMNGIASMMLAHGIRVSGSDRQDSKYLRSLEAQGARVYVGHRAEQLGDATTVVVSSAIREDNRELAEARRRGLRVMHRSAALGSLMLGRRGIAVAGTHGKTTTTAMIAHVLAGCGFDPSFVIGGALTGTNTGGHLGSGDVALTELVRRRIAAGSPGPEIMTFGTSQEADVQIKGIDLVGTGSSFKLDWSGHVGAVELTVPGHYNVLNAAAAYAVAIWLGIDEVQVRRELSTYQGTYRRFQLIGVPNNIRVYDDYAHHPTEVLNTLIAARTGVGAGRVVVCFQPHLYTRTRDFWRELAHALEQADEAIVMDVCGDREDPIPGIDGAMVANAVTPGTAHVTYQPVWDEAAPTVARIARPGDLVITVGCGDVTKVAPQIVDEIQRLTEAVR